jgi:carboxyl-terminal processing protease
MTRRNLLLICLAIPTCLLTWAAQDRSGLGRRFAQVVRQVDRRYIEPVDSGQLFDKAMDGLFAALDPGSRYLNAATYLDLTDTISQQGAGVGVEIAFTESADAIVVIAPIVDGPAWQAGLAAGDRILSIDGQPVAGLGLRQVAEKLRGPAGTGLSLEVSSPITGKTRTLTLTRQPLTVASIRGDRRLPDGQWDWWLEGESRIALIRLSRFGEQTSEEIREVLATLQTAAAPSGLVLDLRGNPGGLLEAAVAVCDLFLDEGTIVTTNDRRQPAAGLARQASPGDLLGGAPLVVLIDNLTASAAEIVAACLQDHGRATIVGSRSYGKGSVQTLLPLAGDEAAVRLTTAEYRRPAGAPIDRPPAAEADHPWGVIPDAGYELTPTRKQLDRWLAWRHDRDQPAGARAVASHRSTATDPAAALPRHADPVLAQGLQAFNTSVTTATAR